MAEYSPLVFADNCVGWMRNGLNCPHRYPGPHAHHHPDPHAHSYPGPHAHRRNNQLIVTDSFEGVIFAAASAEQMGLKTIVNETIDDYWTPSHNDVLTFEQRLEPYLQQAAPQTQERSHLGEGSLQAGFGIFGSLERSLLQRLHHFTAGFVGRSRTW